MNTESLVSVIVPLHNAERYVKRCLRSILSQTYTEIEVIVVDDHSSDKSLAVVKRIADADSRVRILRLGKGHGAQSARYAGIEDARGSRVMFVDSDDILRKQSVELLVNAMDEFDVDLVQMRFLRRFRWINFRYGETYEQSLCHRRFEGEDYLRLSSYIGMDSFITPSLCGKLYRTSLMRITSHTPFDQFWGDDQICNIDYLRLAKSVAFIDYPGYIYRWGGRTTHFHFSDLEKYKKVHGKKLRMGLDEKYLREEMLLLLRYYIRQLNTELGWTKEAVVMMLKEELDDPFWRNIINHKDTEQLVESEFANLAQHPLKVILKRLLK